MKVTAGVSKVDLWLDDDIPLLENGMIIDDNDVELLEKWKINPKEKTSRKKSESSHDILDDLLPNLREDYRKYVKFEKELLLLINGVFEKIQHRQNINFSNPKHFIDILEENASLTSSFLFFLLTKKKPTTVSEIAYSTYLTCCYAVINALKLKIEKKWIENIFNASLIIDAHFVLKPISEFAKEFTENHPFRHEDLSFLAPHCKEGFKEMVSFTKLHPHFLKAVITHHEYYNQKGFFKLPSSKIAPFVAFLTVAQEFVYLTSDFLKDFLPPLSPAKAVINMINRGACYHPKILHNFFLMQSIYPPGELVQFESSEISSGYAVSVGVGTNIKDTLIAPIQDENQKSLFNLKVLSKKTDSKLKILTEVIDPDTKKELLEKCYKEWFQSTP